MNHRHKKFADEYLIDCNITQAAVRAGFSANYGTRLMNRGDVRSYIEKKLDDISGEKIASATEVLQYLTKVIRGESLAEVVVVEAVGGGVTVSKNVVKSPDEKEKLRAAQLLGKRYGVFTEKVEVKGELPVVISGAELLE